MSGGWDASNLLQGHSLAIYVIFIGALLLLGLLTISFRGAVVV